MKRSLFCAQACTAALISSARRSDARGAEGVRAWDNDGNRVALESKSVQLAAKFPSGVTRSATFIALYDRPSTLFWAMYALTDVADSVKLFENFKSASATVVLPEKLVNIQANASPLVFIRESAQRAQSLDEGLNAALAAYGQRLAAVEQGYPETPGARVDLAGAFEPTFFEPRGRAGAHKPVEVREAKLIDRSWRIVLRSENGRLAALTFDTGYTLLGTEVLTLP